MLILDNILREYFTDPPVLLRKNEKQPYPADSHLHPVKGLYDTQAKKIFEHIYLNQWGGGVGGEINLKQMNISNDVVRRSFGAEERFFFLFSLTCHLKFVLSGETRTALILSMKFVLILY